MTAATAAAVETPRMVKRNGSTVAGAVTRDLNRLIAPGEFTLLAGLIGREERPTLARQVAIALTLRHARLAKSFCFIGANDGAVVSAFEAEHHDPAILDFLPCVSNPTAEELIDAFGDSEVCVMFPQAQSDTETTPYIEAGRALAADGRAVLAVLPMKQAQRGIEWFLAINPLSKVPLFTFNRVWGVFDGTQGVDAYTYKCDMLVPIADPDATEGYAMSNNAGAISFRTDYRTGSASKVSSRRMPEVVLVGS